MDSPPSTDERSSSTSSPKTSRPTSKKLEVEEIKTIQRARDELDVEELRNYPSPFMNHLLSFHQLK